VYSVIKKIERAFDLFLLEFRLKALFIQYEIVSSKKKSKLSSKAGFFIISMRFLFYNLLPKSLPLAGFSSVTSSQQLCLKGREEKEHFLEALALD
jgi:hypothetical protein